MELHRKSKVWIQPLLFMLFSLFCVALPSLAYLVGWIIVVGQFILWIGGGICAIGGAYALFMAVRPFRFRIDEAGLSLRLSEFKGMSSPISWERIEAIIMERTPDGGRRIVLVPTEDADIGVTPEYANKADGRPSVILVKLDDVKETPDQIASTLRAYAGTRFLAMA